MTDPVPAIMDAALTEVVGAAWAAGARGTRKRSATETLPYAVWRGGDEAFEKGPNGIQRTPWAATVEVWDRSGRYADTRTTAYSIIAALLAQDGVLRVEVVSTEVADLPDPPPGIPPDAELVRLAVEIG